MQELVLRQFFLLIMIFCQFQAKKMVCATEVLLSVSQNYLLFRKAFNVTDEMSKQKQIFPC